jgi:hypothetical protein
VAWLLQSSKTLRNAGPHSVVGLLFSFQRPNAFPPQDENLNSPRPASLPRSPEDLFRSAVGSFYRFAARRVKRFFEGTSLLPSTNPLDRHSVARGQFLLPAPEPVKSFSKNVSSPTLSR